MSIDSPSLPLGQLGISESLRRFTAEMPHERRPILDFVMSVASDAAPGATVLDVGAGDAPYRELFGHTRYLSNDWGESVHIGAVAADVIAPAWALPVDSSTVDLVLCTQVLEHVPDPADVLSECLRVLRPGGTLALTVPLVWQLHEMPFDYYRYTPPGIGHLLGQAGFVDIDTRARNDSFTTLAQLMLNVGSSMGQGGDRLDDRRAEARSTLFELAGYIASLASLDVDRVLPLGYATLARRP